MLKRGEYVSIGKKLLLGMILVVLSGCHNIRTTSDVAHKSVYIHKEFALQTHENFTIGIMPPQVEIFYMVGEHEDVNFAEASDVQRLLASQIGGLLVEKGYSIKDRSLDFLYTSDKHMFKELEGIRASFDTVSKGLFPEIYKDEAVFPTEVSKINLDTQVFADNLNVNMLLMVRYSEVQALAPLTTILEVALINPDNGDILWADAYEAGHNKVEQLVAQVMTSIPEKVRLPVVSMNIKE